MALTELQIKNSKPKDKNYRISDSDGLSLEVTTSGGKLWRFRYYYNSKEQLLALGKNPVREKKAKKLRTAHEGENTFEKVARRCLEVKQASMNEKYRLQCIARMEQHVFPLIGDLPIAEITIPDVVRVLEKIGERETIETAKRMKQLISQTFRYAAQRGLCIHNPASDLRDVLPSTPDNHYACIPIAELPDLLQDIRQYRGDILTNLASTILNEKQYPPDVIERGNTPIYGMGC